MAMSQQGEFAIIREFFTRPSQDKSVLLGVGDDAALLQVPSGHELVVTTDTLVAGRHFLETASAFDIGWKSLAVNLSDLAAMGAEARWVTLALTLPNNDAIFLKDFAAGFWALANTANISVVGGDTTKGPLSITVTAMGVVPQGQALQRSAAQVGEGIYVSGSVGDAGLALRLLLKQWHDEIAPQHADAVLKKLNRPEPRLELGKKLRGLASACLDISDGLAQDLNHLLTASGVGAELELSALPRSEAMAALEPAFADVLALTSGDDYELLFTAPNHAHEELQYLGATRIGVITAAAGLRFLRDGRVVDMPVTGFQHF